MAIKKEIEVKEEIKIVEIVIIVTT